MRRTPARYASLLGVVSVKVAPDHLSRVVIQRDRPVRYSRQIRLGPVRLLLAGDLAAAQGKLVLGVVGFDLQRAGYLAHDLAHIGWHIPAPASGGRPPFCRRS